MGGNVRDHTCMFFLVERISETNDLLTKRLTVNAVGISHSQGCLTWL